MAGTFVGCTPSNKPILPKNVGEPTAGSTSKDTPRNPAAMIALNTPIGANFLSE